MHLGTGLRPPFRPATRILLLVALAAASLTLTHCRMVGDRLNGIDAGIFRRSDECKKKCQDEFMARNQAEDALHAQLLAAVERQWTHTVARRTHLTGGMGSRHQDEGFGEDWELPPDRAYCETCAGIASVMVSWRLKSSAVITRAVVFCIPPWARVSASRSAASTRAVKRSLARLSSSSGSTLRRRATFVHANRTSPISSAMRASGSVSGAGSSLPSSSRRTSASSSSRSASVVATSG